MGSSVDSIPIISQVKSLGQAISGDTKGAKQTQEKFSRTAPVVSQVRSAVEAIGGDTEAARKTQEAFVDSLKSVPVVSQGISLGQVIAGDSAAAKKTQQQFLDSNIKTAQQLLTGSFLTQFGQLATSVTLSPRKRWMKKYSHKALGELLIPGTHDSCAYSFKDLAGITSFAKTQQFSIYQQLVGGIRWLDIRVRFDGSELWTAHSFLAVRFQTVLNDIKRFIDENPSEIIMMWLQKDGGPDDPTGKAREMANATLGADRFVSSVNMVKSIGEFGARRQIVWLPGGSLTRQNSWTETQSPNPVAAVMNCIKWATNRTRSRSQINLLACQATMSFEDAGAGATVITQELASGGQGLEALATYSNRAIRDALLPDSRAIAGATVITMDFANDELTGKIIGLNS